MNTTFQMQNDKELKYLIIEDSLKVCEGIAARMEKYLNWTACNFTHHVEDAKKIVIQSKPELIFIDWALKGGSAFEVLGYIQNIQCYNPYIIFNTGYQSENPEIPQEIMNNYKVDKYLVKPIWENLRKNLAVYLEEAEKKSLQPIVQKDIWLIDTCRKRVHINLLNLVCICQEFENPYNKNFHFKDGIKLTLKFSWKEIIELLNQKEIVFFVTNSRQHIVVKNYVDYYQRPFIKLKFFQNKIEVVKDKLHEFEEWL